MSFFFGFFGFFGIMYFLLLVLIVQYKVEVQVEHFWNCHSMLLIRIITSTSPNDLCFGLVYYNTWNIQIKYKIFCHVVKIISLQLKRTFALTITKTKNGDNSAQVSPTADDDFPPLSGTTTSDSENENNIEAYHRFFS